MAFNFSAIRAVKTETSKCVVRFRLGSKLAKDKSGMVKMDREGNPVILPVRASFSLNTTAFDMDEVIAYLTSHPAELVRINLPRQVEGEGAANECDVQMRNQYTAINLAGFLRQYTGRGEVEGTEADKDAPKEGEADVKPGRKSRSRKPADPIPADPTVNGEPVVN